MTGQTIPDTQSTDAVDASPPEPRLLRRAGFAALVASVPGTDDPSKPMDDPLRGSILTLAELMR